MTQVLAFMILISNLLTPSPAGAQSRFNRWIAGQRDDTSQTSEQSPDLVKANRLNAEVIALYEQGKYDKALPLAERVVTLREKHLGEDHLLVADALRNLAAVYLAKGKNKEAKSSYLRSIAISEKNLGKDNPELVKILNRYICFLSTTGQGDEIADVRKRLYKLNNGFEYDKSNRPISLAKPVYLPEAKAKRITGSVIAEVAIDETGKVIAVKVLCGHPLLVQGAEPAIWKGQYRPLMVAGKPVRYVDIVTYNFAL
jgi:tetratricopeptide (TPR) repeat protein